MAAVDVTISGVLYDKTARTTQPVVIIGEASLTGLGVGGGPVIPPPPDEKPPKPPWQIWPSPGHPEHPIVIPPEPPNKPPEPIAPPVSWKAVWHPTEGWIVVGLINPEIEHPTPS